MKNMFFILFSLILAANVYSQDMSRCECRINMKTIDTLYFQKLTIKDSNFYPLLDSALTFNQFFNFNKDKIDFYFEIKIYPPHNKIKGKEVFPDFVFDKEQDEDTTLVIISLIQRVLPFGFNNINYWNAYEYKGGFCYKGYSFFVYSWKTNLLTVDSIFESTNEKVSFCTYRNSSFKKRKLQYGVPDDDCEHSEFGCLPTVYEYYYDYIGGKYTFKERYVEE